MGFDGKAVTEILLGLHVTLGLDQACPNQVTSGFISMKYQLNSMKTQLDHFNFPLKFS
jgi:hypothetical protein